MKSRKLICLFVLSVLLSTSALFAASQNAPNIIVILFDDTGWADFGCYGSEIRTPNIDSLAAGGVRFRNFYQAARCSPTRMALMTGLYTQQAAVTPADSLPNMRTDNNITMAELLANAGYRTYMSGKWHLGPLSLGRDPISRGFMHAFGYGTNADGAGTSDPDGYWVESKYNLVSTNNEIAKRQYGSQGIQFHMSDAVGDYAVDFIEHHVNKGDGKPFFLYMPFNAPHFPVCAPAAIANHYTDVGDTSPSDTDYYLYEQGWDVVRQQKYQRQLAMGAIDSSFILSPKGDQPVQSPISPIPAWNSLSSNRQLDLTRRQSLYAAMIEQDDQNIGKVLNKLTEEGLYDNTLIFLCCDNGANYEGGVYGDNYTWDPAHLDSMGQPKNSENSNYADKVDQGGGWANVSNTPFRLFKHFTHEGGIRTAAILHWPAGTDPAIRGTWAEDRGHLIDVMATAVEASGATYPTQFEGHAVLPKEGTSLLPLLQGQHLAPRDLAVEHESNRAFYRGDYKFVTKNFAFSDGSSPAHELELYDIQNDPTEMNNLALQQPSLLNEYVNAWNAWATRVGVPASRLIAEPMEEPDYPNALIQDLFNRPDNTDIDASSSSMTGSLAPVVYNEFYEGTPVTSNQISSNLLQMATGNGMGMMFIDHNFTDASIISSGGFTVMLDILEIVGGDNPPNRFGGFGLGMTRTEVLACKDIMSTANTSMRTMVGVAGCTAVSDFFIDLAMDNILRAWSGNTLLGSANVGATAGRIRVDFLFPSFTLNQRAIARVWFNDQLIGNLAFDWDHNNQNYIGFSARATEYVRMNNLVVMAYEPVVRDDIDLTGDDMVNLADFKVLASQWLTGYTASCPSADLNGDCFVDMDDLEALAAQWLGVTL